MDVTHILFVDRIELPWWATHQRFPKAPSTIITDCCVCRMKRSETVSRIVIPYYPPLGGDGCYQEPLAEGKQGPWARPDVPTSAYYDSHRETTCAPGKGCNANPKRRWGKYLRSMTSGGY